MKFWFTRGVWKSKKAANAIRRISRADIKSIAVIRHAALGDMVLTRSFLIEARKAFPNASITLCLVSNYTRGAPADLVDRVHIVYGSGTKDVSRMAKFRRIRELGYHDLIFDLCTTNKSILTCALNPAMMKIGFPYRALQARLFYDVAVCRSDLNFEVIDMLNMLHMFGVKTAYPHRYDMPGEALRRERPYMIYFAGASTPVKCWPAERFSELLRIMAAEYPAHDHLVLEGIQHWEKADAILEPLEGLSNVAAIQANTIEETTALIKGADLVVANDTGIRHVAIVSETPTVGIFFGDPYRYWPRYDIHEVALPDIDGPPEVSAVYDACMEVMQRTGNTHHI
jgi:ADP-heptose:LPS heptosyltransferase